MSKKISRAEAIGLITAAIGTVYNECFKEHKRELSEGVRKAKGLGEAMRDPERRCHNTINQIMETNCQITELSTEAEQLLQIFDEMVTNSEYNNAELVNRLKDAGLQIERMNKTMESMQTAQAEEISSIRESHYAEIRDYERTIASKDKVIASNSESNKALRAVQHELDELRIAHKALKVSYVSMESNFKSNAGKLIERVKEVNKLKAELANTSCAAIVNTKMAKENQMAAIKLTEALNAIRELKSKNAELKAELEKAKENISASDKKELARVKKEMLKEKAEKSRLQCKCGSIDYARQEWKRKYQELMIQYQALYDTYQKVSDTNNDMAKSLMKYQRAAA